MSAAVFPSLKGVEWPVMRAPIWSNQIQDAVSGAQTAVAYWSYPKWNWKLTFSYLPSTGAADFQALAGFFNLRQGRFDSFLYADADDNSVTDQSVGIGDGATTAFQMVRALGNFVEPIYAPNVVTNVKVNGVTKTVGVDYTVSAWGSAAPGVITFAAAPAAAATITSTFSFYFPCRFDDDSISFANFMSKLWSNSGIGFTSIKLGA